MRYVHSVARHLFRYVILLYLSSYLSTNAPLLLCLIPGGYKKGPVTKLKAGQLVDVTFWNYSMKPNEYPPKRAKKDEAVKQARHGGGACEFSLSDDAGKTWKVIGQYTETCPDVYFKWPVLIPDNVPSCTDSDKCLFAFSWTGYNIEQFYHHCANVQIKGKMDGKLPPLKMKVSDDCTSALGDGKNTKSKGPNPNEVKLNKAGYFANGRQASKTGGFKLHFRRKNSKRCKRK